MVTAAEVAPKKKPLMARRRRHYLIGSLFIIDETCLALLVMSVRLVPNVLVGGIYCVLTT